MPTYIYIYIWDNAWVIYGIMHVAIAAPHYINIHYLACPKAVLGSECMVTKQPVTYDVCTSYDAQRQPVIHSTTAHIHTGSKMGCFAGSKMGCLTGVYQTCASGVLRANPVA
jgi:hypothetical protein